MAFMKWFNLSNTEEEPYIEVNNAEDDTHEVDVDINENVTEHLSLEKAIETYKKVISNLQDENKKLSKLLSNREKIDSLVWPLILKVSHYYENSMLQMVIDLELHLEK